MKDWRIFFSSVFFVLGFSIVFALVGVLLQSVFLTVAFQVQMWLARVGGIVIIIFGFYLVGLFKPKFLEKEYRLDVKRKFKSSYLTSFVFGAAFAVGWTPCIGPILGAILTLAITEPSSAFFLLLSYSAGLGVPFLLVGFFTNQAQGFISKAGKWLRYFNYVFGALLIFLGVLVFTSSLGRIAHFGFVASLLGEIGYVGFGGSTLSLAIAFLAGTASFLSPCVLPLVPAFLVYLGTEATRK